jgi:hypothetical protein
MNKHGNVTAFPTVVLHRDAPTEVMGSPPLSLLCSKVTTKVSFGAGITGAHVLKRL